METLIYILIGIAIVCCVCSAIMYVLLYKALEDFLNCYKALDDFLNCYDELNKKVDALFTLIEQNTKSILTSIESLNESMNKNDLTTYRRIDERTNNIMDAIGNAVYNIKSQLPKRKVKKDTISEK